MSTRYELIGDLLMGAAYADNNLDGREYAKVKQLIGEVMRLKPLPRTMEKHLEAFDPAQLDVAQTVFELRLRTTTEKRKLLELIVQVHDSDQLWDLDEDAYLREVATAMGMSEEEYEDLTMGELIVDEIAAQLFGPPPLHAKKKS